MPAGGFRWAVADFNLDGDLDSNDYDLIDRTWLLWTTQGMVPEGGFRRAVGDFNYDGSINLERLRQDRPGVAALRRRSCRDRHAKPHARTRHARAAGRRRDGAASPSQDVDGPELTPGRVKDHRHSGSKSEGHL